jgi:hypothetical protein
VREAVGCGLDSVDPLLMADKVFESHPVKEFDSVGVTFAE